jgi:hypothetical protein
MIILKLIGWVWTDSSGTGWQPLVVVSVEPWGLIKTENFSVGVSELTMRVKKGCVPWDASC